MTPALPIKEVSADTQYKLKYSIVSLVTRLEEYKEMVSSAQQAGFCGDDIEFLYLDNSRSNQFDGYSGYNHFMQKAQARYLIYCHQDVLFEFNNRRDLDRIIQQMNEEHPDWAILGNAGKDAQGAKAIRITDPYSADLKVGNFPSKVMSIDENFMVIDRSALIRTTAGLTGFHLYGTDLCFNARQLGTSAWVIDFHLKHKSAGTVDEKYANAQNQLMLTYRQRLQPQVIQAMCSRFFVSGSGLMMKLINQNWLLNLHKSISKKLFNS